MLHHLRHWAFLAMRGHRNRLAVALLRAASAVGPPDWWSFQHLGQAYLRLRKDGAAERALRKALVVDPDALPTRRRLAIALLRAGREHAAEQEIAALEARNAISFDFAYEVGSVYAEAHQSHEQALEWFRRSVELRPSFELGRLCEGHSLLNLDRLAEAREAYDEVFGSGADPALRVRAASGLAKVNVALGNETAAIAQASLAVELARSTAVATRELEAAESVLAWVEGGHTENQSRRGGEGSTE